MCWCGYPALLVHFGIGRFLLAIPTEFRRDAENGVDNSEYGMRNSELRYGGCPARQSALLRERVGFAALSAESTLGLKSGSRTAAAPKPAPKSQKWKPHCGLSGLSSFDSRRRCVWRGKHSADSPRCHSDTRKTCPALIYGRAGRAIYI